MLQWISNLFRNNKKNSFKNRTYPITITVKEFVEKDWQKNIDNDLVYVFVKRSWLDKPTWHDMVEYEEELGVGYHRFRNTNSFGTTELHDTDKLWVMRRTVRRANKNAKK